MAASRASPAVASATKTLTSIYFGRNVKNDIRAVGDKNAGDGKEEYITLPWEQPVCTKCSPKRTKN